MLSSEHGEGSGFFAGPGKPGFLVGFAARNDRTLVGFAARNDRTMGF